MPDAPHRREDVRRSDTLRRRSDGQDYTHRVIFTGLTPSSRKRATAHAPVPTPPFSRRASNSASAISRSRPIPTVTRDVEPRCGRPPRRPTPRPPSGARRPRALAAQFLGVGPRPPVRRTGGWRHIIPSKNINYLTHKVTCRIVTRESSSNGRRYSLRETPALLRYERDVRRGERRAW